MIVTSEGMVRPVTARKVSSVWPFVVIRSNSRSDCDIQMTPVKAPSPARKATKAVRKI